ncbi:SDR family NAD(P)-dependent oxidoreductase [soil metagenome]
MIPGVSVLVTGASKGIGAATARAFAAAGANVVVHYRFDRDGAAAVVAECTKLGRKAVAIAADLSRWDEGERLVAESERALGDIEHVVINHGIWKEAAVDAMTAADYDEMMDANVRGAFSVAGAAARRMKPRKRGHIVFVASTAGQRGEAFHAHYAASKGALISLTKSLAAELAPFGIRTNCVAPGWVLTPMSQAALDDPAEKKRVLDTIPLGRVGEADQIAEPIVFLCTAGAAFVNGEIFNVNGGAVLVG